VRRLVHAHGDQLLTALLLACSIGVPLVFVPTQPDVFGLPKLVALQLAAVAGLLLATAQWIRGRSRRRPTTADTVLAVFVLLNLVACVLSGNPSHSWLGEPLQHQGMLTILLYVAFFYLAQMALTTESRILLLFGSIAIAASVVAAYTLAQTAAMDLIWPYTAGRPFSTIGQPNALAAYLVIACPTTTVLLPRTRTWRSRAIVVTALVTIVVAVVLTESRGGYLALAAAAAVLMPRLVRTPSGLGPAAAAIAAAALVTAAMTLPSVRGAAAAVWRRAFSSTDPNDISVQRHLDLWTVAAAIARDHPWVGTGQETYPYVFPQYAVRSLGPSRAAAYAAIRPEGPHNAYLAIASGAGLPTLAAYLGFLALVARRISRSLRASPGTSRSPARAAILAAMAAHLVSDAFMTPELTGSYLFWLLMGAGIGLAAAQDAQRISPRI